MSGTAVTNQLLFVFNLCVFGLLAGPGIFGAQFFGKGSHEGVRDVFRFKILIGVLALAAGITILSIFGDGLINSYLTGEGQEGDRNLIFKSGKEYLTIMLVGLIPFTATQIYASTLRETNCTVPPMFAGLAAVLVNLVLDWALIFGRLGLPQMGSCNCYRQICRVYHSNCVHPFKARQKYIYLERIQKLESSP